MNDFGISPIPIPSRISSLPSEASASTYTLPGLIESITLRSTMAFAFSVEVAISALTSRLRARSKSVVSFRESIARFPVRDFTPIPHFSIIWHCLILKLISMAFTESLAARKRKESMPNPIFVSAMWLASSPLRRGSKLLS